VDDDTIVAATENERWSVLTHGGHYFQGRDALGVALDCAKEKLGWLVGRWCILVKVVDVARERDCEQVVVLPQTADLLVVDRVAKFELPLVFI
jgi:hypothetical protein